MYDISKIWPEWRTTGVLGHGGYGDVYSIERDLQGYKERAAVKIITIPKDSGDIDDLVSDGLTNEDITQRFESILKNIIAEYTHMAELKGHPNIVSADDIVRRQHSDGIGWDVFIRMELLTPLTKAVGTGFNDDFVVNVGADISNALVFCEKQSLLHRDIKPQNIFVTSDGTFKLGDFGISKTVDHATRHTSKAGSYNYMAPEVFNNQPYDTKADMYSFGMTLYWLLNERRGPFLPLPPSKLTMNMEQNALECRMSGSPLTPPAHGRPELKEIVMKACAPDPKDRFRNAEELHKAFKRLQLTESPGVWVPIPSPTGQNPEQSSRSSSSSPSLSSSSSSGAGAPGSQLSVSRLEVTGGGESAPEEAAPPLTGDETVGIGSLLVGARDAAPRNDAPPRDDAPRPAESAEPGTVGSFNGDETVGVVRQPAPDRPGKVEEKKEKQTEKPKKSKRGLIIGAAGVAVVAAVTGLVLLLPPRSEPPATSAPVEAVATPTPAASTPKPEITKAPADTAAPAVETAAPVPFAETLSWTDWDTTIPSGVTGENYAIETRQLFRSTKSLTLEGSEEPEDDSYKLFRSDIGEFSDWTNWGTAAVKADENTEVESRTVENWSAWSAVMRAQTPANIPASTGTRRVQSWLASDAYHYSTFYEYRTQDRLSDVTQYRYRTREVTNYYYDDSGWSALSEDFVRQKEGYVVNKIVQYRYAMTDGEALASPSMDNFQISDQDYSGHFADVSDDSWYGAGKSNALKTVDSLGILVADEYMYFYPTNEITVGELLRAAVIINRIYNGYTGLIGAEDGDYARYAEYAEGLGIIVKGEFPDLSRAATRQEMAYIFYRTLPLECLEPINEIESITDMDMSRKYYDCALTLARSGVISIGKGNTFNPESNTTRAQAAAMIEKLIHPDSRTKA